MTQQRIRRSRIKGWKLPENTVIVDRTSLWGNPFIVGKHGSAEVCVSRFAALALGYIELGSDPDPDDLAKSAAYIKANIGSLRGKNLACPCREGQLCHADVLLNLANAKLPNPEVFLSHLAPVRITMTLADYQRLRKAAQTEVERLRAALS